MSTEARRKLIKKAAGLAHLHAVVGFGKRADGTPESSLGEPVSPTGVGPSTGNGVSGNSGGADGGVKLPSAPSGVTAPATKSPSQQLLDDFKYETNQPRERSWTKPLPVDPVFGDVAQQQKNMRQRQVAYNDQQFLEDGYAIVERNREIAASGSTQPRRFFTPRDSMSGVGAGPPKVVQSITPEQRDAEQQQFRAAVERSKRDYEAKFGKQPEQVAEDPALMPGATMYQGPVPGTPEFYADKPQTQKDVALEQLRKDYTPADLARRAAEVARRAGPGSENQVTYDAAMAKVPEEAQKMYEESLQYGQPIARNFQDVVDTSRAATANQPYQLPEARPNALMRFFRHAGDSYNDTEGSLPLAGLGRWITDYYDRNEPLESAIQTQAEPVTRKFNNGREMAMERVPYDVYLKTLRSTEKTPVNMFDARRQQARLVNNGGYATFSPGGWAAHLARTNQGHNEVKQHGAGEAQDALRDSAALAAGGLAGAGTRAVLTPVVSRAAAAFPSWARWIPGLAGFSASFAAGEAGNAAVKQLSPASGIKKEGGNERSTMTDKQKEFRRKQARQELRNLLIKEAVGLRSVLVGAKNLLGAAAGKTPKFVPQVQNAVRTGLTRSPAVSQTAGTSVAATPATAAPATNVFRGRTQTVAANTPAAAPAATTPVASAATSSPAAAKPAMSAMMDGKRVTPAEILADGEFSTATRAAAKASPVKDTRGELAGILDGLFSKPKAVPQAGGSAVSQASRVPSAIVQPSAATTAASAAAGKPVAPTSALFAQRIGNTAKNVARTAGNVVTNPKALGVAGVGLMAAPLAQQVYAQNVSEPRETQRLQTAANTAWETHLANLDPAARQEQTAALANVQSQLVQANPLAYPEGDPTADARLAADAQTILLRNQKLNTQLSGLQEPNPDGTLPNPLGAQPPAQGFIPGMSDPNAPPEFRQRLQQSEAKLAAAAKMPDGAEKTAAVQSIKDEMYATGREMYASYLAQDPQKAEAMRAEMEAHIQSKLADPAVKAEVDQSLKTGAATPGIMQNAANTLQGFVQDPSSILTFLQNMQLPEILMLGLGVGLAGIGMFNAMSGEGGMGSMLMALLGGGLALGGGLLASNNQQNAATIQGGPVAPMSRIIAKQVQESPEFGLIAKTVLSGWPTAKQFPAVANRIRERLSDKIKQQTGGTVQLTPQQLDEVLDTLYTNNYGPTSAPVA